MPAVPEALMRSRYTAYSTANIDYIERTMRGPAAKNFEKTSATQWAGSVEWQGLEVSSSTQQDDIGRVAFVASYREAGEVHHIKEHSVFHRINGVWYYVDRVQEATPKRNDHCPCGSGKKYKHCCI